jgi:hypothetical protein
MPLLRLLVTLLRAHQIYRGGLATGAWSAKVLLLMMVLALAYAGIGIGLLLGLMSLFAPDNIGAVIAIFLAYLIASTLAVLWLSTLIARRYGPKQGRAG